ELRNTRSQRVNPHPLITSNSPAIVPGFFARGGLFQSTVAHFGQYRAVRTSRSTISAVHARTPCARRCEGHRTMQASAPKFESPATKYIRQCEPATVLPEIISTTASPPRGQNPFDCAIRFAFADSRWVAG